MRNSDGKARDTRLEKLQQYNQQSFERLRRLIRGYKTAFRNRPNQRSAG